jgi:hypothetical protein
MSSTFFAQFFINSGPNRVTEISSTFDTTFHQFGTKQTCRDLINFLTQFLLNSSGQPILSGHFAVVAFDQVNVLTQSFLNSGPKTTVAIYDKFATIRRLDFTKSCGHGELGTYPLLDFRKCRTDDEFGTPGQLHFRKSENHGVLGRIRSLPFRNCRTDDQFRTIRRLHFAKSLDDIELRRFRSLAFTKSRTDYEFGTIRRWHFTKSSHLREMGTIR